MRRLIFFVLLSAVWLVPNVLHAQTAPTAVFLASADHAVLVGGTAVVTSYQLDVYAPAACTATSCTGTPLFSHAIGKPAPDGANTIAAPVPEFLTRPSGTYVGVVSAVGPGGAGKSAPSDPFSWVVAPVPPGKPSIR